jgi:hypothetical protein
MGKINPALFEEIFENGILDVKVKQRHCMRNPSVAHEDKKREKDRRKCRKFKQKFFEEE